MCPCCVCVWVCLRVYKQVCTFACIMCEQACRRVNYPLSSIMQPSNESQQLHSSARERAEHKSTHSQMPAFTIKYYGSCAHKPSTRGNLQSHLLDTGTNSFIKELYVCAVSSARIVFRIVYSHNPRRSSGLEHLETEVTVCETAFLLRDSSEHCPVTTTLELNRQV